MWVKRHPILGSWTMGIRYVTWIIYSSQGLVLRENLQEIIDFPTKYWVFLFSSCPFNQSSEVGEIGHFLLRQDQMEFLHPPARLKSHT